MCVDFEVSVSSPTPLYVWIIRGSLSTDREDLPSLSTTRSLFRSVGRNRGSEEGVDVDGEES